MKKILLVLMMIVLILTCCSCGEKNTFVEGNLLYDLGARSFNDIEKVEFLYKEQQGDYEEKLVISQKKDIELLLDYNYFSNYPSDKLHELFIYPTNSFYVTINDAQYQLYLGADGSLTTVPGSKSWTYKAEQDKGITNSVWEEFIQKYQ